MQKRMQGSWHQRGNTGRCFTSGAGLKTVCWNLKILKPSKPVKFWNNFNEVWHCGEYQLLLLILDTLNQSLDLSLWPISSKIRKKWQICVYVFTTKQCKFGLQSTDHLKLINNKSWCSQNTCWFSFFLMSLLVFSLLKISFHEIESILKPNRTLNFVKKMLWLKKRMQGSQCAQTTM